MISCFRIRVLLSDLKLFIFIFILVNEAITNNFSTQNSLVESINENEFSEEQLTITNVNLFTEFGSHKDVITCSIVDGNFLYSTSKDGYLKCFNLEEKRQTRSINVSQMPISACVKIPNSSYIVLALWDDTM